MTLLVVSAFVAACAERAEPGKTVESLRAGSPTLRDKPRLRIGVQDTVPLMGFRDSRTQKLIGFEIEIAKSVASDLGYPEDRIDWVVVRTVPDRLHVLQNNQADMVVASFSMNKEREELVDFAGPYQLVPQAVLARRDRTKQLSTISDLRSADVRVCTRTGSTSEKALKEKGITPEPVDTATRCIDGLKAGRYDAFSTDLPILAGFFSLDKDIFEILDLEVANTSERVGIAVPNEDTAMRDLIAYFLDRWQKNPREASPWLRAYDRTIGQYLDPKYRSQPLVEHPPVLADYDSKEPRT